MVNNGTLTMASVEIIATS